MLICADSAIACSGRASLTRSRNFSVGAAACATGSAPEDLERGIRHAHRTRARRSSPRPPPRSPARPRCPPSSPSPRRRAGRRRRSARSRAAAASAIRLMTSASASASRSPSTGFSAHQPLPRLEVELALGRAGRARVQPDHAARHGRDHEEREPDRDLERRPLLVGEHEVVEPHRAVADGAELGVARAHRPAGLAHAQDPPLVEVQQVAVRRRASASVHSSHCSSSARAAGAAGGGGSGRAEPAEVASTRPGRTSFMRPRPARCRRRAAAAPG